MLGGVYSGKVDKPINPYLAQVKSWCSLHLVIFNSKFYDTILAYTEKNRNIDNYIGRMTHNKCYVTWPFVAIQYPGFSNNANRQVNYHNHLRKYKLLED